MDINRIWAALQIVPHIPRAWLATISEAAQADCQTPVNAVNAFVVGKFGNWSDRFLGTFGFYRVSMGFWSLPPKVRSKKNSDKRQISTENGAVSFLLKLEWAQPRAPRINLYSCVLICCRMLHGIADFSQSTAKAANEQKMNCKWAANAFGSFETSGLFFGSPVSDKTVESVALPNYLYSHRWWAGSCGCSWCLLRKCSSQARQHAHSNK